ncbi:MAG: type II toxin-antitoxin system RelE/ParE family toxin [Acetobacteraceae bacterium]|nr:type II toxin-antitoxin system RelE/ParE family toxin [Acetobacteraceae bacterium]
MKVVWSAPALRDPAAIRAYLCSFNPVAARRIARELRLAGDSLASFPSRGCIGLTPGTRGLVAVQPYVLVYEATDAEVVVLAIWHGAQDR